VITSADVPALPRRCARGAASMAGTRLHHGGRETTSANSVLGVPRRRAKVLTK